MTDLRLEGLTATPLQGYLAALGVLRLIGEQHDPAARGWWDGDVFCLRSRLDLQGLADFFADRYRPTPVLAPWNEEGGFSRKKDSGKSRLVEDLAATTDERLAPLRQTIGATRRVLRDGRELLDQAKDGKRLLLELLRGAWPDEAVAWLDTVAVLTDEGLAFPILFGSGGNDGRLEFTTTFLGRAAQLLGIPAGGAKPLAPAHARSLLHHTLTGLLEPTGPKRLALLDGTSGQWGPFAAGWQDSPGGAVNPWSWVLMIEGALTFAAASGRRLAAGTGAYAAVPYQMNASPVGYASAADEEGRGEIWAPLWSTPTTSAEVSRLFGEGRVRWRGGQARSAVDAARAIRTFGVDAGVREFTRYVVGQRNGLAYMAVPVGRVGVENDPAVLLTADLDDWLRRLRGLKNPPGGVQTGVRRVDRRLFALAQDAREGAMLDLLVEVAHLQLTLSRSGATKENVPPMRPLNGARWLPFLPSDDPAWRLAVSLASLRDAKGRSLRTLLLPVTPQHTWTPDPADVPGLGAVDPVRLLAGAHARWAVLLEGTPLLPGTLVAGAATKGGGRPARLDDAVRLATRQVSGRLGDLLLAAMLLDETYGRWPPSGPTVVPPAFALTAACWRVDVPEKSERAARARDSEPRPAASPSWPAQLVAGQVAPVLRDAARRLRIHGLTPPTGIEGTAAAGVDGPSLAAAGLLTLTPGDVARCASAVTVRRPTIDRPDHEETA